MEFEPFTKWRYLPLFSLFSNFTSCRSKNKITILPVSLGNKINPKKGSLLEKIRYATSLDIFFANAKAIGISIIASAIAKAQETFATMFVTPENVAKIAPAPISKKML